MTNIIIAILIILVFFIILILIGRYFLSPILFNPKLDFNKTYKYLESKNCVFIEYRGITKNERTKFIDSSIGFDLDNLFTVSSKFRVIAKNIKTEDFKIFWVDIKSWQTPLKKNKIRFIEELNSEEITKFKNDYQPDVLNIKNSCPVCEQSLKVDDTICPDCGLHIK